MVKVGNQGLDDRYIHLRSHRISHPVVSGLRQSHSITFSNVRLDILKFFFHHSSTKFPFNRVSNQNWFLDHDHARLMRLVLRRAICSRINRFRLDLFRCCKSKSCCNLDSWSSLLIKNKKIKREDYKSHSFSFKREHFMRGFRICRQFNRIAIDDRFTLVIWARINTVQMYQGLVS